MPVGTLVTWLSSLPSPGLLDRQQVGGGSAQREGGGTSHRRIDGHRRARSRPAAVAAPPGEGRRSIRRSGQDHRRAVQVARRAVGPTVEAAITRTHATGTGPLLRHGLRAEGAVRRPRRGSPRAPSPAPWALSLPAFAPAIARRAAGLRRTCRGRGSNPHAPCGAQDLKSRARSRSIALGCALSRSDRAPTRFIVLRIASNCPGDQPMACTTQGPGSCLPRSCCPSAGIGPRLRHHQTGGHH